MEKIDAKLLGMVSVTLLTRLSAQLERQGVLPIGWTAQELRQAAGMADHNVNFGGDPDLHRGFAAALRRVAELSIQAPTSDEQVDASGVRLADGNVSGSDEAQSRHLAD